MGLMVVRKRGEVEGGMMGGGGLQWAGRERKAAGHR